MYLGYLEKELKILTGQKATLLATSEQQNKLKQTLSDLQKELNEILVRGKSRAERIKSLEEKLESLPTFEEKIKELKLLEKEKEEYSFFSQKKLELENKLTSAKATLSLKNQERQTLDKRIEELKSYIEALEKKSAKCPTCGQEIGKDHKHKVTAELTLKIVQLKKDLNKIKNEDEETQIKILQTEIDTIRLDNHKYQGILEKLKNLAALEEKREKLISAQASLESEKKVVQELRGLFVNKKSQIEKLVGEVNKLPNLINDLSKLESQIIQKETLLNHLRSEEKEARNLLGQARELLSRS